MIKRMPLLGLIFLCLGLFNNTYADGNPKKEAMLPQLESAFAPRPVAMNFKNIPNAVNWPSASMDIALNVLGHMTIKSKEVINVSKIAVTLGGITVSDDVNLKVTPGNTTKYLVRTTDFLQNLDIFKGNYKILGIDKQVSANDYPGYEIYAYQIVKVTFDWTDSNNNFNEASTNFMLVVGK